MREKVQKPNNNLSSVHDAMAAAAYIKFEQADLEAKSKANNMHRQLSHPIHLSSRSLNPLTGMIDTFWPTDCKF